LTNSTRNTPDRFEREIFNKKLDNYLQFVNMAPRPQATSSSTPPPPQQQSQASLPGMKRGIAIGVAASVCIILIALLAIFAVRRRRKLKAQQLQADTSNPAPETEWAKDEKEDPAREVRCGPVPAPAPLVEADARTIYELDANPTPELPTKDEGRKAQELDAGIEKLVEAGSYTPKKNVPALHISPPQLAPIEHVSLLGTSPLGVSPLGVSPLEEVYFPHTPRSPHGWV
jgi:hypothetical protein